MADASEEAAFTFNWLAMRLLGRGLYSNPWSALSELVANGLDAGADNVHVYVDARDKSDVTVEVIDDGAGMNADGIATYVMVGHNKRNHSGEQMSDVSASPKGRKGIGKLAALFLSNHFYLQTRHEDGASAWELDARNDSVSDDDHPKLLATTAIPQTDNDALWASQKTGTRIILMNVDLTGYGPQSISALGSRLANQFLLPSDTPPRILMWVRTKNSLDGSGYSTVKKSVAFRNFAELTKNFPNAAMQPSDLAKSPTLVKLPAKGLPTGIYLHQPTYTNFPSGPVVDEAWAQIENRVDLASQTYDDVPFKLTGWIGLHASILSELAKENDDRFEKNKYYNPAQLRVYVRGKLASDRLLTQLGITSTYMNYIEGEVSFDLLDEDTLPDIATSNRQDFDETDGRVTLLRALVRPVVRQLIQRRTDLAGTITAQIKAEKERRDASSKRNFSDQIQRDLEQHPEISVETRDELHMVITNKALGTLELKTAFRVFLSHASADHAFASLIDDILQARGARKSEIFYTSRAGSTERTLDERSLSSVIKENLVNANTLIFYMTSKNFMGSQFCLFEGGAGWATRSVSEYLKLNIDFESIPAFLTNGRAEVTLLDTDSLIALRPEVHNYIVEGVLNPMIAHLNRGRDVDGEVKIEPFELSVVPSALELKNSGKTYSDYFLSTIAEHWSALVDSQVEAYLGAYFADPPIKA